MRLPPLPSVADLAKLYGLSATSALSQRFLFDLNVTDKIARAVRNIHNAVVVEVGAGPGPLTRSLLKAQAKHVVAVEKDTRFLPALEMLAEAAEGRLTVVMADALEWKATDVVKPLLQGTAAGKESLQVVANLPFNVSTPLLLKWLKETQNKEDMFSLGPVTMTLMFQKELAERIVALPGATNRSRLSVMAQRLYQPKDCFVVHNTAFVPPPAVDGKIVQFTPHSKVGHLVDFDVVEDVCRAAFSTKRKMLRRSLRKLFMDEENRKVRLRKAAWLLRTTEVDPTLRAEDLTVDQVEALANAYLDSQQRTEATV